jgi:hypothetical protein
MTVRHYVIDVTCNLATYEVSTLSAPQLKSKPGMTHEFHKACSADQSESTMCLVYVAAHAPLNLIASKDIEPVEYKWGHFFLTLFITARRYGPTCVLRSKKGVP